MRNVLVRADASTQIGLGHVMRCLTLISEFDKSKWSFDFYFKHHDDVAKNILQKFNITLVELPIDRDYSPVQGYDKWLGSSEEYDAEMCMNLSCGKRYDLIIVDHYALSSIWEEKMRCIAGSILAIDDISNRSHDCDFLVDANFGKKSLAYDGLTHTKTIKMLGENYVFLRPEFTKLRRKATLKREQTEKIERLLISFGGTDPLKLSKLAVQAILDSKCDLNIDVVISSGCDWINELKCLCKQSSNINLHINSTNIAELMVQADISIGSGGGMSWERCCLGLPCLTVAFIENQVNVVNAMYNAGIIHVSSVDELYCDVKTLLQSSHPLLWSDWKVKSQRSFSIVDGRGACRVVDEIENNLLTG